MTEGTRQANILIEIAVLIIIGTTLCFATHARNNVWKTNITLWEDVIRKSPNKARPYNNLGHAYNEKGLPRKSEPMLKNAIVLLPAYFKAHNNLGISYFKTGRYEKALAKFTEAIRLYPDLADAHYNMGNVYSEWAQYDRAIACYKKAISLNQQDADFYYNLGLAYKNKGRYTTAIEEFKKAIEVFPEKHEAHLNIGVIYLNHLNDRPKALPYLRQTLRIEPNQPQATIIRKVLSGKRRAERKELSRKRGKLSEQRLMYDR